jgi:glycosyltransferase involved in cell wall biosynthesis
MKLLVVMTHYPYPPWTGSSVVAYNSMKHLSKQHLIDLICLQPRDGVAGPAEFVEHIQLVLQRKASKIAICIRYLRMLTGIPTSISLYASRQMKEKVNDALQRVKYDAILLFEMSAIQYCPSYSYSKIMVNIEDPQSIRLHRMAELPIWSAYQRAKLFVLAKFTECYERRLLTRMAKVLLLSASDIRDMHKHGRYKNLSCMPYGVEIRNSAEIAGYDERERSIVFSGNMFHPPNVDGGLFLLKDIFPLILREYPAAILWIVGADPDKRIYKEAEKFGKQVVITGRVSDVATYIKRATVSICPVRLKIGVQTKILEALSWGTPVVTTSAGNSGIEGVAGTHLWVENEPHQIAKRVVDLLQGRGWMKLSEEGRKLVSERFSWENSVTQLERHIETLVDKN